MTNIDDKELENISGAGDGSNFDKQIGTGGGTVKPPKEKLLVDAPSEEPIGGSGGVTPVEDLGGLGGSGDGGTFNKS